MPSASSDHSLPDQGKVSTGNKKRHSTEFPRLKKVAGPTEASSEPSSQSSTASDRRASEKRLKETTIDQSNPASEESLLDKQDLEGGVSIDTESLDLTEPRSEEEDCAGGRQKSARGHVQDSRVLFIHTLHGYSRIRLTAKDARRLVGRSSSNSTSSKPLRPLQARIAELSAQLREQGTKLHEAEGTIREKEAQINTLTETIARLHQRDGETTKNDSYFVTQFSDIEHSIKQWTLTHFPRTGGEEVSDLEILSKELQELVHSSAYRPREILKKRKTRLGVISSVLAVMFYRQIFDPFIFGGTEANNTLLVLGPRLRGTGKHPFS